MHKLLLEIPSSLETERLIIRKYKKRDGQAFFALLERKNNRELLREHVKEAEDLKTEEDAEINVRERIGEWVIRRRFVMGILLKNTANFVGQIWIEPKNWEVPSFELGYFIDPEYQGQGIATEAAKRSVEFLFENLHAHKVIIITRDTNERSWKLAERLGFTREGHHRECNTTNGKRWGLYYYGMLRDEFNTR